MNDTVSRVLSLVPRDAFSLVEILRLCHTCKGMRALITQNHGPILVDVSLDVEQMRSVCGVPECSVDCEELTYDVNIATTRDMMAMMCGFDRKYHVHRLSLDFCHEGYQARLAQTDGSTSVLAAASAADCHHRVLFSALQSMQRLQRVNIYNVNLSTDLVAAYLSTFAGRELSFVQCGLHMGPEFLNAIGRLETLVLLSLSGNTFLPCTGTVNVVGPNLQVLNCSACVSADVAVLCSGGLPNTLRELYWNDNHVPEDDVPALRAWLSSCQSMSTLGLRNTSLCGTSGRALLATLLPMPQLAYLDLACNEFGEDVLAFAELMPRLRHFCVSARRCHHGALGVAWCASRKCTRDDKFCMYEELEREDIDVDV